MIYDTKEISVCFFRSTPIKPSRKILVQLTEKCNLKCKHCFVSSEGAGIEMKFNDFRDKIIPALKKGNITRVTLTGGEPMTHSGIMKILYLLDSIGMHVTLCTNGTLFNEYNLNQISKLKDIHINVSLDGLSASTHGRFRGDKNNELFKELISNIQEVGKMGLLNGVLCTPNNYCDIREYKDLCEFASENNANYVLFNPLSSFGRGEQTLKLGYSQDALNQLRHELLSFEQCNKLDIIYIRFPSTDKTKKLSDCNCDIPYIFADGSIAICPYLVFAANTGRSKYKPEQFFVGNVFDEDIDIAGALQSYKLPRSKLATCKSNTLNCSRGCKAAKIANGQDIDDCDFELCNKSLSQ